MLAALDHPIYGRIVYDENFWTGKRTISIGGVAATKISKNIYRAGDISFSIAGNFLFGLSMMINNETIVLTSKAKWYEIVLYVIPIVLVLTWGNSPQLCSIFPIIGGGLGGAFGAIASCLSMFCMKQKEDVKTKLLIGLGFIAGTVLVGHLLARVFLLMII